MRYRWKLLILLLTIALLPLLAGRTMGLRLIKVFENKIVTHTREELASEAESKMRLIVDSTVALIWSNRERIETALAWQAREVERALASEPGPLGKTYFAPFFRDLAARPPDAAPSPRHRRDRPSGMAEDLQVSYSEQVFHLAPDISWDQARDDLARLSTATSSYRAINQAVADLVLWQYTSLKTGVHGAYPGHEGIPSGMDARLQAWFRPTDADDEITWTKSYIDPETRKTVIAAVKNARGPDGQVAGVTAIIVPFGNIVEDTIRPALAANRTHIFLTIPRPRPGTGEEGVLVAVGEERSKVRGRSWRTPLEPEWLESSDREQFQAMIADFKAGRSGSRRMPFQGRDSLWVYGPTIGDSREDRTTLTLIAPYDEILAPTRQAEENIQNLMNNLALSSQLGMFGVVILVIVLAFSFSRTVTRPLRALAEAARRLASGDFDVQIQSRSRDELGDLGRMFNSVGPRLKEHYQMSHSLHLAREVQQSLMPRTDPSFPGLDLAGRSIYCDETGGDYYDYIDISASGRNGLAVVVGDVSDHGIQSALLMASARAYLRQRTSMPGSPAEIISDVNRQLTRDVDDSGRFMTMFFCLVDPDEEALCFVNAGHDPALLYDQASGTFEELSGSPGLALGVLGDFEYGEERRRLGPGQILVIGTDGIWEAHGPEGRMFGKEEFRRVVRENAPRAAREIVDEVVKAVDFFREDREQEDDVTLVVIKVL
ncbi:MAG: SpoIIE family protein phosphatase [Pseudomonadota bacterium]